MDRQHCFPCGFNKFFLSFKLIHTNNCCLYSIHLPVSQNVVIPWEPLMLFRCECIIEWKYFLSRACCVSQLVENGINWDALANPLKELAGPWAHRKVPPVEKLQVLGAPLTKGGFQLLKAFQSKVFSSWQRGVVECFETHVWKLLFTLNQTS